MKLDSYPFDGWDWTELGIAWNVYTPDDFHMPDPENEYGFHPICSESDPIKWYIDSVMGKYDGGEPTRVMRKCARDCRIFLSLLGNPKTSFDSFSQPMWFGMSKIENDWTLLSHVRDNISSMWD